jgi:hypothetical protein
VAGVVEVKKVVIDTDLLVRHAIGGVHGPSDLRKIARVCFCYTTVFHAIEAFSVCQTDEERRSLEETMRGMKLLGLNAKSGKSIGAMFGAEGTARDLHRLAAGVCIESRLPMVSTRRGAYANIAGLTVIGPEAVVAGTS